ncbi:discoidin domain-containing protein [Sphingomonas sp. ASV193]|uniref:discoidin domain-containing protein n=1 Tax=Sphingomonas sp. ASV193 TaxID=3144405 RepID=UPI0032E8CAE5
MPTIDRTKQGAMLGALATAMLSAPALAAPTPGTRTYANPIDIDYRYNWEQQNDGISYRTGADPAVVNHKGRFYLFETLADGYWMSDDLASWTFVKPSIWRARGVVAPAAWSDGERLYMMPALDQPGPIYVSDHPETGQLDYFQRRTFDLPGMVRSGDEDKMKPGQVPPGPWDPALFKDDDGRWYLYWGSSNVFPVYGIEIDPRNRFNYIGKPQPIFTLHPETHGWERFGKDHSGLLATGQPTKPYVEGAWMTKVGGRYYLQYGAPGTEFNVYANGTYVADKPLGEYKYAPWNPVSYKPGGFVIGAGHGSTFADNHGNWWNTGTPWIGYNWTFERRVAMFPTRFYPDGQMAASSRFGDFPHYIPDKKVDDLDSLFTGWMLLSYRKPVTASSTMGEFAPSRVTDENYQSFWVATDADPSKTLTVDLGSRQTIRAVQVDFADYKAGRFGDAPDIYTEFRLEASDDGQAWREIARTEPPRRDRPNAYFQLPQPVQARFVRYVHGHIGGAHLAIAELRIFGSAGGAAPARPALLRQQRDADARDAHIAWRAVPGATGYNVRWGVRPDRLTFTYQKFADQLGDAAQPSLDIRALNAGVNYWVAVEAFNASGVSKLSAVKPIR